MIRGIRLLAVAALMAPVACVTNPYTGEREVAKTAKGAALGAAGGAVVGLLIGDHGKERRRNAAIGAGVGTLAGGVVGAYMDRQESRLRQQLQGTGVGVTRIGDRLVLNMPGNVTFGFDRSEVDASFFPTLGSVALVLQEFDKTLVHVAGHTDETGGRDHNFQLSRRRADSVASYLRAQGVRNERLYVQGFGPDHPVASNSTADGRQRNRRVEITLEPLVAQQT